MRKCAKKFEKEVETGLVKGWKNVGKGYEKINCVEFGWLVVAKGLGWVWVWRVSKGG